MRLRDAIIVGLTTYALLTLGMYVGRWQVTNLEHCSKPWAVAP